jgi:hypothetical protein
MQQILQTPAGQVAAKIARYRKNFPVFAHEQLRVKTKPDQETGLSRVVPMYPLLPPQQKFYESYWAQVQDMGFARQVWLKSRQQGGSTLALAILFQKATLFPNTNTFTAANDKPTATNLFRTEKLFYESMGADIRPKTRYSTKTDLVMEDEENPDEGLRSSMMVDTANNINLGISRTLTCIHLSEVARYTKGLDAVPSILGAIPMAPGTVIILESTAHVIGEFFKSMCERAERGEGAWRFCFAPWFISPEYAIPLKKGEKIRPTIEEKYLIRDYHLTPEQVKWRRYKIDEFKGDENFFKQEFCATAEEAWITLGYSVLPPSALAKLKLHIKDPIRKCNVYPRSPKHGQILDDPEGQLWIWAMPESGATYDVGGDVSLEAESNWDEEEGRMNVKEDAITDYSAIQVVHRGTLEQVAEWKGRVHPIELAEILAVIGYFYNTAQLAPEAGGIGVATTGHLSLQIGYPNIYRWRYRDRVGAGLTRYAGWETGIKSKQYLIAFTLSTVINRANDQPLIHSERLYDELVTFVRTGYASYGAAAGNYDDITMAWMIAIVTSNDEDFTKYVNHEEQKNETRHDEFYEPGKAPRHPDADPAMTEADSDSRMFFGDSLESDGWL